MFQVINFELQGTDRREEKHFEDGGGPSHGKRHRQRASPHRYLF